MRPRLPIGARGLPAAIAALALLVFAGTARADLAICNRMSYVVDAALALENKGTAATRGWFRIDPGQCDTVLHGAPIAERLYLHVRTLALYGTAPLPRVGHDNFCIADKNFVIAAARHCRGVQKRARFTRIKPAETENGLTAYLAEEAGYDDAQARLAGIQRLLTVAGYDATPIDGVNGPKTEAALTRFLKDRNLSAQTANADGFFKTLLVAARKPQGHGFAWCNETPHMVMAAIGLDDNGVFVTRGWYRVKPGQCLRPEVRARPSKVYSYAEAVDGDRHPIMRGAKRLVWGGKTMLCTRENKFEIADQQDCATRGLMAVGFAAIDLTAKPAITVRFKE